MRVKKKKSTTVRNIMIISAILLIAVLGTVFYKIQLAEQDQVNGDGQSSEQQPSLDEQVDSPTEVPADEEESTESEGNVDENLSDEEHNSDTQSTEPNTSSNNENPSSDDSTSVDKVKYIENQPVPTEPTYVNGVLLVNKKNPLPPTYNNGEDPVAKEALQGMFAAGKEAGFTYEAFSGFRSYEYQSSLYNRYVARDGKEKADRYSARPGYSEHQTGLAFDIGEAGRKDLWLTEAFGETEAGKWLMNNAHKYGFILRYPKEKEHITGFMYESWHYRYVGIEHATKIYEANVTLEEYLGVN